MRKKENNYAFIDAQNLYLNIQNQGWKLDYIRFRKYLSEKYAIEKAYMFLGFLLGNRDLYDFLNKAGFVLIFKPATLHKNSKIKGNCDVELSVEAIISEEQYSKAIIVSGDGDFFYLVRYLHEVGKLQKVLIPNVKSYAKIFHTIDDSTRRYVTFISDLKDRLEYKQKSTHKDGTS
jgi:uncharacterized LabA/DUF88 family protein